VKLYSEYRRRVGLDQIERQVLPPPAIRNPFEKGPNWNLSGQFELMKSNPALAEHLRRLAEK
jgi:hypothetical protein